MLPSMARGGSFPRTRRVRARPDFLRIQASTCRAAAAHFVLVARQSGASAPPRLGIVVTRKVGNAVVRNRIKRLCRECFRRLPDFLPHGVDVVAIARAGAGTLDFDAVAAEWVRAAGQVRRAANQALAQSAKATHASGKRADADGDAPRERKPTDPGAPRKP